MWIVVWFLFSGRHERDKHFICRVVAFNKIYNAGDQQYTSTGVFIIRSEFTQLVLENFIHHNLSHHRGSMTRKFDLCTLLSRTGVIIFI